ncbi:MAG TPA: M15 family metallopeptidase [Phnomibacter sp.]|nr:M15 family metallopeptidase [Phnomibacter sp.]
MIFGVLFLSVQAGAQPNNPYHLPLTTTKKELSLQAKSQPSLQMVPLDNYIKGLRSDIRYATPNNFTGKVLYKTKGLYMRKIAAEKMVLVADSLRKMGLGILVYDAYRPYAATLAMWQIVPDDRYAANPANGSGHNRGIAIDLTLCELQSGEILPMPTGYDNFSDTAHHSFLKLDKTVLQNRAILKGTMEHFGFVALETEWWHYALPNAKSYPLMDIPFDKLGKWLKEK